MNATQKLTIILAVIASVTTILVVAISKSPENSTQSAPQAAAAGSGDSTADHHKPKPVDSAVFDGLIGKAAPEFTAISYEGKQVSLKDYRGQNVLLFFNEGLMCYPACWNQIVAFGKDTTFKQKNTVVLNITVDSKEEWKKAIDKMPELSGNTVILDPDRTVANLYGVLSLNSSMHRGQFPGHTYILIDKDGIVRFTKDDDQMAVRNNELITEINKL